MSDSILLNLVEQDFGLTGSGRWFRSDEHSSLVIDAEKDVFYFNSLGIVGGPLEYLIKVRGMPFREARNYLKSLGHIDTVIYTVNGAKDDVIVYPKLVDVFYENGKTNRSYWYSKGFTDKTIDRFQLGYYDNWYLIPIFVDGTFRQFQKRHDIPKKEIKSWYRGLNPFLFNSDVLRLTNKIIITEGPNDAIILMQNGIPAVSHNGGSEYWSESWFSKFITQKEIYIVYDNDDAGRFGVTKVAKNLGIFRSRIYTFPGYEKGYDPVDFFFEGGTAEQFLDIIYKESKYIFEG